jgi:Zn-finger nucleic acid-binding protein
MRPEERSGVVLDRCPVCGDVWCDRTELAAVVTTERPGTVMRWGRRLDQRGGTGGWQHCPRDATPTLRPYDLDGIPFRRCTRCQGVAIAGEDLERLLLQAPDAADPLRHRLRDLAE